MFASRYFNPRYWAARFWPKVGEDASWPTSALPRNTVDVTARPRTVLVLARNRTVDILARQRGAYHG